MDDLSTQGITIFFTPIFFEFLIKVIKTSLLLFETSLTSLCRGASMKKSAHIDLT